MGFLTTIGVVERREGTSDNAVSTRGTRGWTTEHKVGWGFSANRCGESRLVWNWFRRCGWNVLTDHVDSSAPNSGKLDGVASNSMLLGVAEMKNGIEGTKTIRVTLARALYVTTTLPSSVVEA